MDFTPTYARRVSRDDEGSDWYYIDPSLKRSFRVEVDVVPERATKVRIQHLDRDMRGRSEWVPVGRLKVPWALATDFEATEAAWDRLYSYGPDTGSTETALILLETYLAPDVAGIYYNGVGGVLEIHDVDALATATKLGERDLTGHADVFIDGAITYAPWPTTLRVMRALCRLNPQPALELMAKRRANEAHYYAQIAAQGDPEWVHAARDEELPGAKRFNRWKQIEDDANRLLRSLLDAGTPSLADDFLELRDMYLDLVRVMPMATARIRMIRATISEDLAAQIESLVSRPLPRSAELLGAEMPSSAI